VYGESTSLYGVWGDARHDDTYGVVGTGEDNCPAGCATVKRNAGGVLGKALAFGAGVWGQSPNGPGVVGESSTDVGVRGHSVYESGVRGGMLGVRPHAAHTFDLAGVTGISNGDGGIGVKGVANTGGGAYGVFGVSAAGYGVVGQSTTGYAGYFIGKVGITGADLAEHFAATDNQPIEPGTVIVVDENQPGKIRVSDHAYDHTVIGIISGAGGIHTALMLHQDDVLQGDLAVAIAGRVYCKAEADSAPIKPGDLLTTSSVKGLCMKSADRDQAYGAVIGKALTGLDKGEGLVLVLVNLQ
jgi:hypothetical protein